MRIPLTLLAAAICNIVQAEFIVGVPLGFTPGTAPLVRIDPESGGYTVPHTTGNSYNALAQNSKANSSPRSSAAQHPTVASPGSIP